MREARLSSLGPPPEWVRGLPIIGSPIAEAWGLLQQASRSHHTDLLPGLTPAHFCSGLCRPRAASAPPSFSSCLLLFFSAVLYAKGELAASAALRFGARLAGARGEQSVRLAARAVRGVALGVVVTALIQASIGGVGLALAEVPFAPLLSAVLFILCIAQIGPGPILVPAVIWMFATDRISSGVILAVATVLALGVDNIIRPVLIRREANLPILLILAGVIGGLLGFGLIGLFLGPTVLAIAHALLSARMTEETTIAPEPQSGASGRDSLLGWGCSEKSFTDHVRSLTQTAIRRDSQSVPLPSAQGI